jgi:hypothetical protein
MAEEINADSMMEEQREVFHYEPSIWPFFITPSFLITCLASLLVPYLVSPPFWSLLLPASKNPSRSNMYFHTMLTSTIHAIVSTILTSYILGFGLMGSNRVFSKSPLGFVTMQISLGYFIGDLIVCLLDPKLRTDRDNMIHHVAGIVGLVLGLFYQGKFMFFVVYRLIAECSTPFVNLHHILHNLDKKDGTPYIFAGIGMLITFVLCRIIVIPWHWYEILAVVVTDEAALLVPLFFRVWLGANYLVFDILNVYWCYKITRGALKLLNAKRKAR